MAEQLDKEIEPVAAEKKPLPEENDIAKPLKMSFADWKKNKEAKEQSEPESETEIFNARKLHKNGNKPPSNNRNNNNNINNGNNNRFLPPLSRPPPMTFPIINFNNFGPGPNPMMSPCNMGPAPRCHRPLQPPPFWEDMMSPQHQPPPPIQPPMPKCPSLWNLVPKDKAPLRQNKKPQYQPNKKYKISNNNSSTDTALMPPPPAPMGNNNNAHSSSSSTANGVIRKKKGGTFVQIDGKWIQKPEAPLPLEEAPPGTKEERQRQWKEYRQAMKPFKNREFHNWKRTVQRLSKLPRDSLDEKQLERLQKAEEYIGAHKAMLTIKHAEQWVQQNNKPESSNAQGQVYVRKPAHTPSWEKKDFHATAHKPQYATGRAIKGGVMSELNSLPPLPSVAQPIGQFTDATANGFFGQTPCFGVFGQDANADSTANSNNSYFQGYNSSFVKGGTLLPP